MTAHSARKHLTDAEQAEREAAHGDAESQRLYAAWRSRYDDLLSDGRPSAYQAEQAAYDQLVDYVEAHGLNHSEVDPR